MDNQEEVSQTSSLEVGASLTLTNEESAEIIMAERAIQAAQHQLGARREQFLAEEAQMMSVLGNARRTLENKVKAAGAARGLIFEGDNVYSYDASARTFTRTK